MPPSPPRHPTTSCPLRRPRPARTPRRQREHRRRTRGLAQGTEEAAQHSLEQSASTGAVHSDASLALLHPCPVPVFRMLLADLGGGQHCMWMNDGPPRG